MEMEGGARTPGEVPAVDVETAVAAFLHDPVRTSLELPPMAASQRKLAKAVADRYPELTCESYGLGLERRLHLFKRGTAPKDEGAGSVSVKNTFIDDWISPTAADDEEPVVFRSMPPLLPQAATPQRSALGLPTLLTGGGKLDLSPINEGSPKWPVEPAAAAPGAGGREAGEPSEAVFCPALGGRGGQAFFTERTDACGQPALVEGFGVRNTFIHIDCMPPDERSVQSMPHDMFRRCLQEEAAAAGPGACGRQPAAAAAPGAGAGDASTRQPPSMPAGDHVLDHSLLLVPGLQVIIQGLTKLPAFNGQTGVIESLDEQTGRYSVLLSGGIAGLPPRAKVKAENLRPAVPPPSPPAFASALDHQESAAGAALRVPGNPLATYAGIPTPSLWAEDAFAPSPLRLSELV